MAIKTLSDAITAYEERFGSLDVTTVFLDENGDLGKRLLREINQALESGERMDEKAFERDYMAGVPSDAII